VGKKKSLGGFENVENIFLSKSTLGQEEGPGLASELASDLAPDLASNFTSFIRILGI
jgi:hypothetical protein